MSLRTLFLGALFFQFLLRMGTLGYLYTHREVPFVTDDSMTYVLKSRIHAEDPKYQSPLLKSFDSMKAMVRTQTLSEYDLMRQYHRIKEPYHPAHILAVSALTRGLGMDSFSAWWVIAVAGNIFLLFSLAALLWCFLTPRAAGVALTLLCTLPLIVTHELAAAPREWSVAIFFTMAAVYFRRKRLPVWSIALASALMVGLHPIGKLLSLQLIAMLSVHRWISTGTIKRDYVRTWLRTGAVEAVACIAGWFCWKAIEGAFGFGAHAPTQVQLVWWRPIKDLVKSVGLEIFYNVSLLLVPRQGEPSSWAEIYSRILGAASLTVISAYFILRRAKSLAALTAFGATTAAFQAMFFWLGQPYEPVVPYFFFSSYYLSLTLVSIASLLSAGFDQGLKWLPKILKYAPAILISAQIALSLQTFSRTSQAFARSQDMIHPKLLLEATNRLPPGDCLEIEGELMLYSYFIYGSFERRVSYQSYCPPESVYSNRGLGLRCDYILRSRGPSCLPKEAKTEVIFQNRDFALERILSPVP